MKTIINIILGILAIGAQPLLLETSDWGINYLNAHPTLIKPIPLLVGLGISILFTMTISPISNATKPLFVGESNGRRVINPFWGWLIMCAIINVVFNMLLE